MTNYITFNDLLVLSGKYETSIDTFYNELLGEFIKLFNGTESNPYRALTNLNSYFATKIDLIKYLCTKYGDRCFGKKFVVHEYIPKIETDQNGHITNITTVYATEEDAYQDIKSYIIAGLNSWILSNKNRYIRMIGALELNYDPIENYDRNELVTNVKDGTRTNSRTYALDADPHSLEVNAPLTQFSLNKDYGISAMQAANKVNIHSIGAGASVSDEELGKVAGTASVTESTSGGVTTITPTATTDSNKDLTNPTTVNSVNTYETDVLKDQSKSVNSGTKAELSRSSAYNKNEEYGHVTIRKEKVDPNYSDSETFKDYEDVTEGRVHGNIGVTTTQQMLEQELLLRAKPVIHNIVAEIMDQVMLHIWE